MNQILVTKLKKKNKKFFKVQLILSIIAIIAISIFYKSGEIKKQKLEKISSILDKNMEITQIYKSKKQSLEKNIYLGKIVIEKIDLEYAIINEFSEEFLKIAPCKFYGGEIGKTGNICIAGHNYNDNRFFSRLEELELKDEIKLIDLEENEYTYVIFKKFEADETDVKSVVRKNKQKEITLLTCNNSNKKRLILKAFLKE